MARPSESIESSVQDLIKASGQEYRKSDLNAAVQCLLDAWALLPDPATKYDDSYHLATYLIRMYTALNDHQSANKWADILQNCDLERIDDGEREFIAGKVAYEAGDRIKARKMFSTSFKKSEGRSFDGEDPKFLHLLTSAEKQ